MMSISTHIIHVISLCIIISRSYGVYISWKVATNAPPRTDHGKILNCIASHPELPENLQCSVHLSVHVLPMRVLLFQIGGSQSRSRLMYVQEDSPTSIMCKSIGSFPATEMIFLLESGNGLVERILPTISSKKSILDDALFDTEGIVTLHLNSVHHGKYIKCFASLEESIVELVYAKVIIYGPPEGIKMSPLGDLYDGKEINVTCKAVNRYPAPYIHWYIGSRNLTEDSSLNISENTAGRFDIESTLTLIPTMIDHGKRLLCEAVQPTTIPARSVNQSLVLNITYFIPNAPSRLIVDKNQTTSSTLFVAWQPVFDGGYQQTFNLEYCPNNTAAKEEECGVITNLTQPPFTLDGLKAFTWYRLALWAENRAGNSSTVTAMASTAPLQPENYGVSITRVGVGQVLHIHKANQSLGEVCFVLKSSNESCALLDKSKCIYPTKGIKEVSVDADDDVVVTYGRGLCSEPANITDQPGPTVPSSDQGTPYMIIAIGVIASISVIIVISLGLTYFYGLMCCTKRKNANRNATQHQDSMEGQGIYTELTKDRPSHSSGPGTSYYMDLKPTNPTSTSVATSDGRGDHDYDTPNVSNTAYMDADSKDGHRPNHDYVSPSSSPKGSESHYMNTDGMVLESESDGHQSINHLYTGEGDRDETTTHIYMDMKPMQMPSTSLGVSSVEDDTPDEEEVVYANTQ